jgi:cellulose synthase/poly-beta-1,6-N-acetylglucosamine synthase-like glycosyltransferase
VGGFAVHDADDLLITLLYRAGGWQGVYVPEIHAKGLTPTDYRSYLNQQRRWSRSVLDVKLRAFPKLARDMPLTTRLMSFLHGFYYVQEGVLGVFGLVLLVFLLSTGVVPAFLSLGLAPIFLSTMLVLTVVDFYRQRFFLDRRREWGFHYRAAFLRAAKWPYMFFGLVDAASGRKRPYLLTSKVKRARKGLMTWPHLVIAGLLVAAWLMGFLRGIELHPLVLASGIGTCVFSLFVVWTETWEAPAPFDLELARAELGPAYGLEAASERP